MVGHPRWPSPALVALPKHGSCSVPNYLRLPFPSSTPGREFDVAMMMFWKHKTAQNCWWRQMVHIDGAARQRRHSDQTDKIATDLEHAVCVDKRMHLHHFCWQCLKSYSPSHHKNTLSTSSGNMHDARALSCKTYSTKKPFLCCVILECISFSTLKYGSSGWWVWWAGFKMISGGSSTSSGHRHCHWPDAPSAAEEEMRNEQLRKFFLQQILSPSKDNGSYQQEFTWMCLKEVAWFDSIWHGLSLDQWHFPQCKFLFWNKQRL